MAQWNRKCFHNLILERDKVCQHCGGTELLQSHHIEHRAKGGVDDPANGICLCAGCHADEHPDVPRQLFFVKAFGPYSPAGWPATYVAGLLYCSPQTIVKRAKEAGIKRCGGCWAFTEDDLAILSQKVSSKIPGKARTTISLESEKLWRDFQSECRKRGLTASGVIGKFIRGQLEDWAEQTVAELEAFVAETKTGQAGRAA